jgi:hypothetical protein
MPYVVEGDLLCHIWTGRTNPNGTPVIRTRQGNTTARRYYWEKANGPVPEGKVLGAWCGNRMCVRERHAVPVTPTELAEMQGRYALGEKDAARALVMRRIGVGQREVARRLGVSPRTIKRIEDGSHRAVRQGVGNGT